MAQYFPSSVKYDKIDSELLVNIMPNRSNRYNQIIP